MAKRFYWSITESGTGPNKPPKGLECAVNGGANVLVYVRDANFPTESLLDIDHPEVLSVSTIRGSKVAVLAAKLLSGSYECPDWRLDIEYDDTAVLSGDLSACDVCNVECMTCERQAYATGRTDDSVGPKGEKGDDGKSQYQSYLDTTADDPPLTEVQYAAASGSGSVTITGATQTNLTGLLKGTGTNVTEAVPGDDYMEPGSVPDALEDLDTIVTGAELDSDHAKLNLIESEADVTDSENVGAAIGNGSSVTSPSNSYEVGFWDGAILWRVTWQNIKTTLQSVFATIAQLADKADLVGGKIPTSQIPAIALTEFLGSVANETAMLALNGQAGDWCIRTDEGLTYVISGTDPTDASDWTALPHPAVPVNSVNGQTGVITLGKGDVGLANADNTSDNNKPVSSAAQLALDLKADISALNALPVPGAKGIFLSSPVASGDEFHAALESDVTLSAWQLSSGDGVSGSVELDVWITTDGSIPTVSNSITNGNWLAIVSGTFNFGTTSGFSSTTFSRGDRFVVKVRSLTTMTNISFSLTD